jgi:hypothetical protein
VEPASSLTTIEREGEREGGAETKAVMAPLLVQ